MPTKKLWQKNASPHVLVEQFTSSDDIILDQNLIPYDIIGSMAHISMLKKAELLSESDYKVLKKGLINLYGNFLQGKLVLSHEDEDVHTRIENELSYLYPDTGGNVHLGRSRNDQVLVDLRLFTKDKLHTLVISTLELAASFVKYANNYQSLVMPGYTHMQPAMVSSVGLWASQFAESLMDDNKILMTAYELNDQNPLGSGASYGIPLPIDREYTTKLLGFSKVQNNSLYCQNSRGKIEAVVIHSLVQIMLTLSRFAQDVLLFTTAEYKLFSLPENLTTGSSIMPQKRNVDIMELVRAKAKIVITNEVLITSIINGLPSGYNRDVQEIKLPLIQSLKLVHEVIKITALVVDNLMPNPEMMSAKIGNDMMATHHAYQLSRQDNLMFREAYRFVGSHLDGIPAYNPNDILQFQKLNLDENLQHIQQQLDYWTRKQKTFSTLIANLIKE